jgi:hypothetical protein
MASRSQPAPDRIGRTPLTVAAWIAGLLVLAVAAGAAVRQEPMLAPAAVGAVLAGAFAHRWPAATLGGAFAVTGLYGTLDALTPIPGGASVDAALVGLWVAAAWAYLVAGRSQPVRLWPGAALLALFVGISLLQVLGADDLRTGLRAFHGQAWYIAAALLIAYLPWSAASRRRAVSGLIAGALLAGLYACLRLATGPAPGEETAALAMASNAGFRRSGDLPLIGGLPSPKLLAAWCAATLPFLAGCVVARTGVWRVAAGLGAVTMVAAIFGSEARLGLVAGVAGVLVVLVLFQLGAGSRTTRLGPGLIAAGCAAAVVVGGFALVVGDDPEARDRFGALTSPGEIDSVQERQSRWSDAIVQLRETPTGLGIGTAGSVARDGARFTQSFNLQLDNSYLKIALEQGPLVLVFAAGLLLLVGGLARRALAETVRTEDAMVAAGAAGTAVAFAVLMYGGLFVEGLTALAAWLLIGIGMAAHPAQTPNDVSP